MAGGNRGGNIQLIVVALGLVIATIGWFAVRRHDAVAIASGDASGCWTATCRDAIIAHNFERAAGR